MIDYDVIETTLTKLCVDEDARQDAWVEVLERQPSDIDELTEIARRHRHKHIAGGHGYRDISLDFNWQANIDADVSKYEFFPALPLEPINDGGFSEEITTRLQQEIQAKLHYRPLKTTDVLCRLCGSQTERFGVRKGVQYYRCLHCGRKFVAGRLYRSQYPVELILFAIKCRREGLSEYGIQKKVLDVYGIKLIPSTIHHWVTSTALKLLTDENYSESVRFTGVSI